MAGLLSFAKNNDKAAQIRQKGNELYQQRKFEEALKKYNESICWAENESEQLSMGFANRSAASYELKEYEFALANIALARRHNYPEQLMPKLERRERDCYVQISQRPAQEKADDAVLRSRLSINVEVNPRIPYIAKDIHLEELPGFGRAAIADRDFKVGDVLAQDRPLLACTSRSVLYGCCDCCGNGFSHNLIPCQHCVWVMYCDAECLQKSWKLYHRFECGLTHKLHDVADRVKTSFIGPRQFFYTLSLLDDDIKKMMNFCKNTARTGSNPLNLDYVNYDPLEELKEVHKIKFRPRPIDQDEITYCNFAAQQYLRVYRQNPLVKSLITTKGQMKFTQERFAEYVLGFYANAPKVDLMKFCIISSVFFDAEDPTKEPNVTLISSGGRDHIVVHQAVAKGSHLCYRNKVPGNERTNKCPNCPLCTKDRDLFSRDWHTMCQVVADDGSNFLAKLNAMQQFLQKHSNMATQCRFKSALEPYQLLINGLMSKFVRADLRAKAIA